MSVNKVILVGNLGQDPKSFQVSSGLKVSFSLATSEKWKSQDGENKEKTEWHNIIVWGKQAEFAEKYLSKGRLVYIEGRIQTRTYEDNGKKYITEIIAQNLQALDKGSKESSDRSSGESEEKKTKKILPKEDKDNINEPEDDDMAWLE